MNIFDASSAYSPVLFVLAFFLLVWWLAHVMEKCDSDADRGRIVVLVIACPAAVLLWMLIDNYGSSFYSPYGLPGFIAPRPWWSDRQAWLIGAIGGPVLGLLVGGMLWVLLQVGNAPRPVIWIGRGLVALGAALTAFGLAAVMVHQPPNVYRPLLIAGPVLAGLVMASLWAMGKLRQEDELLKMRIQDASDQGRGEVSE